MRLLLKRLIRKSAVLSHWIFDLGIGTKVPIRLLVFNYFVSLVSGKNPGFYLPVHHTSQVVAGSNLTLSGSKRGTFSSLALSGGCYLQAGNGITIGEGTIWGPNVTIISANHGDIETGGAWIVSDKPVSIGKNCWLGANVTVLPGVRLGDNTVVGAGAVVTRSYPAGDTIIVGNPAKPLAPKA